MSGGQPIDRSVSQSIDRSVSQTLGEPLSLVWKTASALKNWSYDYNIFSQVKLPVPVVSVGNLSSGGTGKTPVVQALYNHYRKSFKKIAIVSRNYKATVKTFARVDLKHPNPAAYFGDEPTWLARFCPESLVFVGPNKSETARRAFEMEKPDLILIDDGFQHRALARDLDLVLIDVSSDPQMKLIPAGLYREGISSLKRAHYVLLTKVNWVEESVLAQWRARIPDDFPIVEVDFDLQLPGELGSGLESKAGAGSESKAGAGSEFKAGAGSESKAGAGLEVAAFAGLAHSEKFKEILEEKMGRELLKFWGFKDHFDYPPTALDEISRWLKEHPKALVLTTEKDAVKLGDWIKNHPQVKIVPMTIQWGLGAEEFLARINKLGV